MTEQVGRPRKVGARERWWRVALAVGAFAASMLGSELIASQEAALSSSRPVTAITVPVQQADGTLGEQRLELAPIPTAIPRSELTTVARSRSSR
jgi:hypothetical protein